MERIGCTTLDGYLDRIEKNPSIRVECEACLRVTISRFYRDRRLWEHLRKRVLPELMGRFPGGLTAWSAGCANGEEPYTLAMVWEALVTSGTKLPPLRILATDANTECLNRAEAGRYPLSSLKEVTDEVKSRWFRPTPGGRQWQIDPRLKKYIHWQVHDLLAPPPRRIFQLVFLRNNLLTYHQGKIMINALDGIAATLANGGILILGSHERLPVTGLSLKRENECPCVYFFQP
jgi:chemotaxis protein methyltransferase CheR